MRFIAVAFTLTLTLCASIAFGQNVTFDFDKRFDFRSVRTFAWVPGRAPLDTFNDQRVVAAVDDQLVSRRILPVGLAGRPDVLVAYHASFDRDLEITGFSTGWGGYRFPGPRSGVARTEEIVTGTLIVDVIDARTKTIVWRGTARKEIKTSASPEARSANIAKATAKMFRSFPVGQ
jgi:hypothetical protein